MSVSLLRVVAYRVQGHTTRADAVFFTAQIKDAVGNEYGRPKDIVGETRMAFTSHADAAFDVCFENQLLSSRKPTPSPLSVTQ